MRCSIDQRAVRPGVQRAHQLYQGARLGGDASAALPAVSRRRRREELDNAANPRSSGPASGSCVYLSLWCLTRAERVCALQALASVNLSPPSSHREAAVLVQLGTGDVDAANLTSVTANAFDVYVAPILPDSQR